jgi:predicted ribosome quality control (RQC) complex YloA/Tae2 family protein
MKKELFEYNGIEYTFSIGKNKEENFELLDDSNKTDIWFHVENETSCYVILTNVDKINTIPKKVIKKGAYLCKINSKSKYEYCSIMYTPVENVEKTNIIGNVIVSRYWTITV